MPTKQINIADSIITGLTSVTKVWTKQRKAEERERGRVYYRRTAMVRQDRVTIRDAAWQVIEEAYNKASDNGRLPCGPRQIMYAARPQILELTGKDALRDNYFTQTLLPDYINANPRRCQSWYIIWDARGHFVEPHTGYEFGLGTLEVDTYLGLRPEREDPIKVDKSVLYPTLGPENRYETVLFVEKEGFDPLFAAVHLAARYDLAITSTKGMSNTSVRKLFDRLMQRGIKRILVLHDFDRSGFSIFGTLGTSNRRYRFQNPVNVIDIGLRLADVEAMGLESEPHYTDKDWRKISATLARHGATEDEIDFLQHNRVELNAMTSPQLIAFIEGKLEEHGVTRVIPDEATLVAHARRLIEQDLATEAVERLKEELAAKAAKTRLPRKLTAAVEKRLKAQPALSWDQALAAVLTDK